MTRRLAWHAAAEGAAGDQTVLPGLRSGVLLIGDGEEAELRDMRLGQVVKLGGVATQRAHEEPRPARTSMAGSRTSNCPCGK